MIVELLHLDGGGDPFVAALHHIDDVGRVWLQHRNVRLAGDLAGNILLLSFCERNLFSAPGKSLVRRLVVLLDCKDNVEVAILGGCETEFSLTRILILR